MKTFLCNCGNRIFFENSQCVQCGSEVGWCPACQQIVTLLLEGGHFRCGHEACGRPLAKCANYLLENICNRCLVLDESEENQAGAGDDIPSSSVNGLTPPPPQLCDYCRYTETIPDLSVTENRQRWYRLEVAKRRLLYSLDMLGLPYGGPESDCPLPLSFDFKTDQLESNQVWQNMGDDEQVYTGHAEGKITINVREADDAERERLRVDFQEAHRTLIGHFRHEIGHYYWQLLVENRDEPGFREVFGDHRSPAYAEALARYYEVGPPSGWQQTHLSAYATMHPWEDFAETFATYLDMVSVLDTAKNMGLGGPGIDADFPEMARYYQDLGIVLNEMSRAMGLIDLVPEVFHPETLRKMQYVNDLVRKSQGAGVP